MNADEVMDTLTKSINETGEIAPPVEVWLIEGPDAEPTEQYEIKSIYKSPDENRVFIDIERVEDGD